MQHRYKVGQMLDLRSAPQRSNRRAGPCEVVFCLPHDNGPILYRVKSLGENNERVVDEIDLSPSDALNPKARASSISPSPGADGLVLAGRAQGSLRAIGRSCNHRLIRRRDGAPDFHCPSAGRTDDRYGRWSAEHEIGPDRSQPAGRDID